MNARIIGIDLAVEAAHRAIVFDYASHRYISPVLSFHADPAELDHLLQVAGHQAPPDTRLLAIMEATHMAWFPVSCYLNDHGVEVYRVTGQQTADQRRAYQRHAKSDRIDARILVNLYLTMPERLHRLRLPSASHLELQRACRELAHLTRQSTAILNRLQATDAFAWLGLADAGLPPAALRWLHSAWYNPYRVVQAGPSQLAEHWQRTSGQADPPAWLPTLLSKARQVMTLYHPDQLDFDRLQAYLTRQHAQLERLQSDAHGLRLKVIRPLYRHLHPHRYLESVVGIGQDSAAVYIAFIGSIQRFPSVTQFRSWSGMIPYSAQSGESQAKGLHITQAGPDLVKATAFLNANVARLYDPQLAAIYYDQMVNKGKHHTQAVCACATHLLNRIYAILCQERPYQLRDVDDQPVTAEQARRICQQRYRVPAHVRQRNTYRVRTARTEQRIEQRSQRLQRAMKKQRTHSHHPA